MHGAWCLMPAGVGPLVQQLQLSPLEGMMGLPPSPQQTAADAALQEVGACIRGGLAYGGRAVATWVWCTLKTLKTLKKIVKPHKSL